MLSRWTVAGIGFVRLTRLVYFPHRHLIRLGLTRFENSSYIPSSARFLSHHSAMDSLASLSLNSTLVAHTATNSPATWRDALATASNVPASFELLKTLVYKPKTAKTATPVPVVVIAREDASVSTGAIGKKLNLKELRLASEDLLKDFFSLDKDSRKIQSRSLKIAF